MNGEVAAADVSAVAATPAGAAGGRDRLARVVLSRLVRPGHRDLAALIDAVGAAEALDRIVAGDVPVGLRRVANRRQSWPAGSLWEVGEQLCEAGNREGARLLVPGDDEWPAQLSELAAISSTDEPHTYPPLCLWVRGHGRLRTAVARAVAIVGTQAATSYGVNVATHIGQMLAVQGWTVVSCTSSGVNAAAHRGALAAADTGDVARGGVATDAPASVSVLPGGIDVPYPKADAEFVARIAEYGLLVTERPPGTAVWPYRFRSRDRLIAAFVRGVVMVEVELRGGARNTADWARRLDRVVMAVPGQVTSPVSAGTHAEIAAGTARLVTSAEDLLAMLDRDAARPVGAEAPPVNPAGPPPLLEPPADDLDPRVRQVLDAVPADRAEPLEVIAARAGLSPVELRCTLPELVARGLVDDHPAGYRRV